MDKKGLINMYNATSTDDGKGSIESYENWLERQLLSRVNDAEKQEMKVDRVVAELSENLLRRERYKNEHFIEGEYTENWAAYDETTEQFKYAISVLCDSELLISTPQDNINIYAAYGNNGKWCAAGYGIIKEPFNTPQEALKSILKERK